MNQIKIKFTNREMNIMISFLDQVLPERPVTHIDKLLSTCLAELLHKLKLTAVMVKKEYSVQIKVSWGLALVHFCTSRSFKSSPDYRIVVNKTISLIDQKTI